MRNLRCLPIILLFWATLFAQESLLQSGPMVGYSEMREVLLWAQTNQPAKISFRYWEAGKRNSAKISDEVNTKKSDAYTAKIPIGLLEPGLVYEYELLINGKVVKRPYPLKFQTQKLWQWREDPPAVKFVIGSCAYVNEPVYDRPGTPYGANYEIFTAIHQKQPEFMIWMGDNTYLREADWFSRSGILHRYTHTRSLPELQPLWGSTHHYAIWDDHDYGPNNSDRSFREKATTLETFKLFWGNPSFGLESSPGVTTMFQWADLDFFMLDNRSNRSPEFRITGERTILGDAQIEWLIDALKGSFAPFKFVVVGGQFLNSLDRYETFSTLPAERERILNVIAQERIPGVFFLDGDRHHTELSKLERYRDYPIYDLTVSPLTAGPNPRAANEANRYREDGTFYGDRNFAVLEVNGPRRERVLKITIFDTAGNEVWNRSIEAKDLQ
ncbi:MAG: alkaline phosphatase family protein [Calditrichaeota bacterium]|nr:alkaline phosphatase family protein [Calditrichota bacterium]